jgi:hypothetical protein
VGGAGGRVRPSQGGRAVTARAASRQHAAARGWAARGRPVLPVGEHKRPLTTNGLLDATCEPDVIDRLWQRWPDANVAIRTGAPSGLVVLDVDGDQGADALHELERRHGRLPRTASVTTPRGGAHFYWRHPGRPVKTTAGALAPGIDVRGDGGYALVPPSVGANGRAYEWDEQAPPAPMPAWLTEATAADARSGGDGPKREPASTWVAMVANGLTEGERNAGLTRLVGHLLRRDVDVRLVGSLAHLLNEHRVRPALPAEEVERIIESIAGREVARRRAGR